MPSCVCHTYHSSCSFCHVSFSSAVVLSNSHMICNHCKTKNLRRNVVTHLLPCFICRVASAIVLQGAVCFHSRAESIKDIVGRTALEATATIYNITGAIERMQNISKLYNISSQSFDHLNSTVKALNSEAVEIQAKAEKNMRLVSKGINTL